MKFTYNYLTQLISKMESKSKRSIEKLDFDSAIQYLSCIAILKYRFYLGYKDDLIEQSIQSMSRSLLQNNDKHECHINKVVFYDSFSKDNKGLTEQYLEALISIGYEIVYIHCRPISSPICTNIRSLLEDYDKAQILQVPSSLIGMNRVKWIYENISNSGASKLFMHLMPDAIVECIAFAALSDSITRYQINLTDHAFWVGTSVSDYSFEFRQYGCNLTLKERGISQNRILLMPFFPIMRPIPFQGFPVESNGKFVFFTGGALYKMMDSELTFFSLCKDLLDACPNAVIIVAGGMKDDKNLNDAIALYDIKNRMIPIGNRRDIYEVFKHCDAYINTYPVGGGLMCQLAAHCHKPILNYRNISDEDVVGQKEPVQFTSSTKEVFVSEAVHLYNDKIYRHTVGEKLNHAVISSEEFAWGLNECLSTHITSFGIQWDSQFKAKQYNVNDALKYASKDWSVYNDLYSRLKTKLLYIDTFAYIKLQIHRIKNGIDKKW